MLADGVEGASRALQEPTPSRIRGLVTRIVDQRVQDGQLDECGLTLAEVARIRLRGAGDEGGRTLEQVLDDRPKAARVRAATPRAGRKPRARRTGRQRAKS